MKQWMLESPFLTFFLAYGIIEITGKCFSRFLRFRMVSKYGWPPSHLDADGDWKPKE